MKLHEILNTFITIVLLATIFLYWFVLYPELEKPEILVGNGVRVTYDFGTDVMRIEAEERFDPNKLAIPQIQNAFDDYNQVYTDRKNIAKIEPKASWEDVEVIWINR